MEYLAWNNEIGKRYFNPERNGARVFLYVNTDIINEIGATHRVDLNDFKSAIKIGPPWVSRHGQSICQQALQALENWRTRELEFPPYLGYLAFFVLADTIDVNGFSRYSYYPGLRSLLGEEPSAGGFPSFDRMYQLWFDLEQWTNDDRKGELGVFRADILGKMEHVGLPKAQTALTDDEREKLPLLFAENGFDPFSPPSDIELASLLSHETHHHLLPHTKQLLRSTRDDEQPFREMLVDIILEELQDWDGSAASQAEFGGHERIFLGNLRLTMALDKTAGTARIGLRCRSNREYPEEGLSLSGEGISGALYCLEDWQGWSTPFSESESQTQLFDASRLDWRHGITLADQEHLWKITLSKRPIRVMISAAKFGFDGYIEDGQIPKSKSFYLLAGDAHAEVLQRWGAQCCDGFCQMEAISGLPDGWRLYFIVQANSDAIIRDEFPFLAFPTALRIQLRGGLKVSGNQYFAFALPGVVVTGMNEGMTIFCNDHPLSRDQDTGFYEIPDSLRSRRFVIEVRCQDECVRRRSLYALETVDWRDIPAATHVDRFGLQTSKDNAEFSAGPFVYGFDPPLFNPEIFLPPSEGHRVFFIGRNPGEIAVSPAEPIPNDWSPVWVIPMRKRGHAIFCGTALEASAPTMNFKGDKRSVSKWKEILWYRRKRIEPPQRPAIRQLWEAFKETAERVR
jgi:hypothetical protein